SLRRWVGVGAALVSLLSSFPSTTWGISLKDGMPALHAAATAGDEAKINQLVSKMVRQLTNYYKKRWSVDEDTAEELAFHVVTRYVLKPKTIRNPNGSLWSNIGPHDLPK